MNTPSRFIGVLTALLFVSFISAATSSSVGQGQPSGQKSGTKQTKAPTAAQPMQSATKVTGFAQSAASTFADYSVCSLPPDAQDSFQKAFRMGFFLEKGNQALSAAYQGEVAAGFWSKVKNFPGPQKAAEDQINQLFKNDQTLSLQEVLRLTAANIDPDFGNPTKPAAFDQSKLNPFTKAEGDALLKAATDAASQFASANPPQMILCSQSIVPWNEASDVVGRRVANNFIVIQVVVRNMSSDHEFLLQDVQALLNTSRFYATHDHDVVRGVAEMGQTLSPRNIVVNTATALGTSVGAAYAILSANAKIGLNIWQAGVVPGIQVIFPDNTVRQVARIDSLACSPGGSAMVIPKNSAVGILAFLPQKQFLWPCISPATTDDRGASDNAGSDANSATATTGSTNDAYHCLPPPQKREIKWLKLKSTDQKLKDLNSAQMNRLQESLEVLVAGVQ